MSARNVFSTGVMHERHARPHRTPVLSTLRRRDPDVLLLDTLQDAPASSSHQSRVLDALVPPGRQTTPTIDPLREAAHFFGRLTINGVQKLTEGVRQAAESAHRALTELQGPNLNEKRQALFDEVWTDLQRDFTRWDVEPRSERTTFLFFERIVARTTRLDALEAEMRAETEPEVFGCEAIPGYQVVGPRLNNDHPLFEQIEAARNAMSTWTKMAITQTDEALCALFVSEVHRLQTNVNLGSGQIDVGRLAQLHQAIDGYVFLMDASKMAIKELIEVAA